MFEDQAETLKHGFKQCPELELTVQPMQPKSSATLEPLVTLLDFEGGIATRRGDNVV